VYRKQVRRRRAVLVLLIVASLVLLSSTFDSSGGPVGGLAKGIASVLGPLQDGASRALKPARDLVNWFDETFQARGENSDLKAENAQLRAQLAKRQSAVSENKQLKQALHFQDSGVATDYRPVTARVIGRSPTVWYSTVTVDAGSGDGVEVNDPVVAGQDLVGRVTGVTGGSAVVTLITDHRSAVSAKALPDGPEGVVEPEAGDPNTLLLDFIQNDAKVHPGDILVTAGWSSGAISSAYPYGIEIGRVTQATTGEQGAYQKVRVRAFADLRGMDFVQILTGGPKRPGVSGQ
jgi:rod shape-determining protein MreC